MNDKKKIFKEINELEEMLNHLEMLKILLTREDQDKIKHKVLSEITNKFKIWLEEIYKKLGYEVNINIEIEKI